VTAPEYKNHRLGLGLTQAQLAAILGIPRTAICRRETGQQRITAEAVRAIKSLRPKKGA
jgi:transcriptional regulator with XRE-family HTH domain